MKVLIADFDLYEKVGGGQTFYRSIIAKHPDIEFFYLASFESRAANRPPNAHPIVYRPFYTHHDWKHFADVAPPRWSIAAFLRANNVAHSVAGHAFDVVDLPDYEQFGMFLRPALVRHKVRCDRIALSLHGRISTTVSLNWGTEGKFDRELRMQEDMQYQTVDVRYGLSRTYLDEWREAVGVEGRYLSPLRFMEPPRPTRVPRSSEPPDIYFIGRSEKRKGPDIFVDLAWWLPRGSYRRACIVGPQDVDPSGVGSNMHLYTMANNRMGPGCVEILPAMSPAELAKVFASRSVVLLPSRYDTFNLIGTEALLAGCPTAIGGGAGVCRFLNDAFPDVPFVTIDVDNAYASIPALVDLLENYDAHRDRLVAALKTAQPETSGDSLDEIYASSPTSDASVSRELDSWYERLMSHGDQGRRLGAGRLKSSAVQLIRRRTSPDFRRQLRAMHPRRVVGRMSKALKHRLTASPFRDHLKSAIAMARARRGIANYQQIHAAPERTAADVDAKVKRCGEVVSSLRIDRIRLWRETARLEAMRGNDLVAATYRLRAMRLGGEDRFHDLPAVVEALETHGFAGEAAAADAMYGAHPDRADRCRQILDDAYARHQIRAHQDFELFDDRRERANYRASVIVSLYDAADKLPMFLKALSLQSLIRSGEAEVVLIDSGSPGEEYAAFRQTVEGLEMPVVYARSARRETIQSAWNRGIEISRAPYLSFLGVDEAVLPPCLEILAGELDADPSLDWVQANSLVTNVGDRGQWLNDVMTYDRTDYKQPFVYLETCYLSWVGALYRRSIHERCGMYDASFAAAGDTEFKNRVLPFIKSKILPRTLGVFWNYPSDRTTCSPRAEIEDLRAWYLHRTLAGVRYAFQRRNSREAEELLYATLRYRKSFCRHWSTDVEYADNLSLYLREGDPQTEAARYSDGVAQVLGAYRSLDWISRPSSGALRRALAHASRVAAQMARAHQQLSDHRIDPAYRVFNDNRHEQHNQVWPTAA